MNATTRQISATCMPSIPSIYWSDRLFISATMHTVNDLIEQARLREAFRQAIAIVKLEGWEPKADFYVLQERVISGELTCDEAVKIVLTQPLP